MSNIESELRELRKDVNALSLEIRELSELVRKSNSKMGGHIDFVEGVYTSVRHPLDFIKKRVECLTGKTQTALPEIEYNQNGNNIGMAPQTALQK